MGTPTTAAVFPAPVHTRAPSLEGRVWRETTRRLGPHTQDRSPRPPTGRLSSPGEALQLVCSKLPTTSVLLTIAPHPAGLGTHTCCCPDRGGRRDQQTPRVSRDSGLRITMGMPTGTQCPGSVHGACVDLPHPVRLPLSSALLPERTLSVAGTRPPAPAAVTAHAPAVLAQPAACPASWVRSRGPPGAPSAVRSHREAPMGGRGPRPDVTPETRTTSENARLVSPRTLPRGHRQQRRRYGTRAPVPVGRRGQTSRTGTAHSTGLREVRLDTAPWPSSPGRCVSGLLPHRTQTLPGLMLRERIRDRRRPLPPSRSFSVGSCRQRMIVSHSDPRPPAPCQRRVDSATKGRDLEPPTLRATSYLQWWLSPRISRAPVTEKARSSTPRKTKLLPKTQSRATEGRTPTPASSTAWGNVNGTHSEGRARRLRDRDFRQTQGS